MFISKCISLLLAMTLSANSAVPLTFPIKKDIPTTEIVHEYVVEETVDIPEEPIVEQEPVIEEVIEPFLLKLGFLQRTPRGRVISDLGCKYLGVPALKKEKYNPQMDLLEG